MAKFSLEREDESEEGPSSPKKKKKRKTRDKGVKEEEDDDEGKSGQESKTNQDLVRPDGRISGISVTLTDPDVLDCTICMEPLIPPIFQCENGHIACSSCCTKLNNKCPSCSWPIGYCRCLAIEKVIESIKVSCGNAQHGCKETVTYTQKQGHEETCAYAPCVCPHSDCTFSGSSEQLSRHFSSKHWDSSKRFRYNCPFSVSLDINEPFLVFQEEEDGLLFLLNNRTELIGNVFVVTCIKPNSPKGGFSYDLISRRGGSSLRLQSFTKYMKGRIGGSSTIDFILGSSSEFLMVPFDFFSSVGKLKLEVCIWSSRELE